MHKKVKLIICVEALAGIGIHIRPDAQEDPVHLAGKLPAVGIVGEAKIKCMAVTIALEEIEFRFLHIGGDGDVQVEAAAKDKFLHGSRLVYAAVCAEILSDLMEYVVNRYHGYITLLVQQNCRLKL